MISKKPSLTRICIIVFSKKYEDTYLIAYNLKLHSCERIETNG